MRRHVATVIHLSNSAITRIGPSWEYRVGFKQCLQRDILQLLTAMKGGRSWPYATLFPFAIPLLYSPFRSLFHYHSEIFYPRSILSSSAIVFCLKPLSHFPLALTFHLTSTRLKKSSLKAKWTSLLISPLAQSLLSPLDLLSTPNSSRTLRLFLKVRLLRRMVIPALMLVLRRARLTVCILRRVSYFGVGRGRGVGVRVWKVRRGLGRGCEI